MQKARRRFPKVASTACKHTVSGSFHSPSRSSFHLSLTVLVRYRSLRSIQPWTMVCPSSNRISRVPPYLIPHFDCRLQDFHLLWRNFPVTSANLMLQANPVSLAATQGISSISFPTGTQMFQFPAFAKDRSSICRVAPFGHLRVIAYLQLATAFRSLSRPSQPLRAQASTVCSFTLFPSV